MKDLPTLKSVRFNLNRRKTYYLTYYFLNFFFKFKNLYCAFRAIKKQFSLTIVSAEDFFIS